MHEDGKKLKAVFDGAIELHGSARQLYLDRACQGDAALREQTEKLLHALERAGNFLTEGESERKQRQILSASFRNGLQAELSTEISPAGLLDAGDRLGNYKILQKIGEGGCGVVYMAEQETPVRRRVALKVIKLGMDTKQVIARFEAERQALALMDYPNIAKVLDAGATDTGRPYFVMELVRGIKITDYCDQHHLPTPERLELFIKVCHAIQHAHQKGVIHRDIKPSNILVTLHDGVPVPKVIDFGIAKATEGRLTDHTLFTAFEQFIGTPAYMSPEQAEMSGLDVDTRSDIYSLGVLLYELLTGKTPFDAKELVASGLDEMRKTIREREPARPSTRLCTMLKGELATTANLRAAEVPKLIHLLRGDLDWIVMKALAKDRTRRYETANSLAMDVRRHLSLEPVIARPPSQLYRIRMMVKRNKLAFAATCAVTLTLLAGLGFSTWAFVRERKAYAGEARQRREAEAARARAVAASVAVQRHFYAANMSLAQRAWDENNVRLLQEILGDTREWPERSFEWSYWQRQTHLALKTLRGHLQAVTSVAFSPDDQWIVSGSEDQTAKIWETASGRLQLTLGRLSTGIRSVAFSPDGQRIATGSGDQNASVWDAASGQLLFTLEGHQTGISSVAFSPDGQRIATGSWDQTAKIWDGTTGKLLRTLQGHTGVIWSLAFSPDSQRIVTGSRDGTAKVWIAVSGSELFGLNGNSNTIWSVAFSPNNHQIITGSTDRTAKVWDAAAGQPLFKLEGHGGVILAVGFSPDSQRIVTGSDDATAKVWDASSGRELRVSDGHSPEIRVLSFFPDGRRVVTRSRDQSHAVLQAANGKELATLTGHTAPIRCAAFSPDGRRVVTGSRDQTARLWEAASGRELRTLKGHSGQVWSLAFSPDGRRIVTGSGDRTARVWDAASGVELLALQNHTSGLWSVAFSPDGHRIITGGADRTARVWDAATGQELLKLEEHSGAILSVAFSPDGQRIITGSADQTAKVWDAATGHSLFKLEGHSGAILSAVFSPDGQRIVTGSGDLTGKLWETVSGRELLALRGHTGPISSVLFSADGRRIATVSEDQVKLWEAASADQVAAWQTDEQTAVANLAELQRERAFAQGQQRIARARDECAIKRWLMLAPISLAAGQSGIQGLASEQIRGEAALRPKAGEGAMTPSGELKWQEVIQDDYIMNFHEIVGQETLWSVVYMVCYLRSEAEQRGLQLLVGSDDQAKVYLNGKQIHTYNFPREFVADQDTVEDVVLKEGLNVVVFKVVNEVAGWQGSLRFADAQGNPLKDVTVTLTP